MKTSTSFNSMKAIVRLASVLCVLFWGVGNAWGDTDTYDFNTNGINKGSGPNSGAVSTSSANVVFTSRTGNTTDSWTIAFTGDTFYGYGPGNGVNFGANSRKNQYPPHATLTSKSYSNVTAVAIEYSGANTAVTLAVSVGGTSFGSTTTSSGTSHTFSHAAATGAVVISVESSTNGQIKINSVAITYSAASCGSDPTITAASNNGAVTSTNIPVQCASGISNIGGAGCSLTDYGFVWKTTSAAPNISTDTKQSLGSSIAASTAFNYTITGLTPNTKYYVYAYATNGHGTGYSSAYEVTTLQRYTISYNNNGGSSSMGGSTKDHGVAFALPANAGSMTKTGHHIIGWLLNSGSGTHYDLGGSYTTNANATFYAEWTANTYQVAFNANGGSGSAMSNQDFTYGTAQNLSTNTYTAPEHKYFIGWNTNSSASTALYTDGQSVSDLTDTDNETVTLYAIWKDHTYTNYRTLCSETYDIVLHDNNGGSHNGSAKVANNGTTLTNIEAPTKKGYSVEGYYTTSGMATKIATDEGALQSDVSTWTDEDGKWVLRDGATFYAKWEPTNYTITYEGLEGASNTNPTSYTIETATIVLANPGSREGYTFAGWTCGGDPITQIVLGTTGNKTITATWSINTPNLAVSAADHVVITATPASELAIAEGANRNVNYNKTVTLNCAPEDHWSIEWDVYKTGESSTKVAITGSGDGATFTMPDYAVTVSAVMTEAAYKTVCFKNNGEDIDGYASVKVYVGESPVAPTLTDGTSGDACDPTSDKHYGWTKETWTSTIATQSEIDARTGTEAVYAKSAALPVVAAGDPATITYHAVWAAGSGSPAINSTLIAKWDKQALTASTAVKAKDKDGNTLNDVTMTSSFNLATEGTYCYQNTITSTVTITISGLDFSAYDKGALSFYARGSQQRTIDVDYSTGGAYSDLVTTPSITKKEQAYEISNIPKGTTSIKLTYTYGTSGETFYFGTVRAYGVNNTPSYEFTELTDDNTSGWTGNDWDGYYIITGNSSTRALRSSGICGFSDFATVSAVDSKISTSDIGLIFRINYSSENSGFVVQGLGGGDYMATVKVNGDAFSIMTTTVAYLYGMSYNSLAHTSSTYLKWSTDRFGIYSSSTGVNPTLYKMLGAAENFLTTCCTQYDISGACTSGTAVTGGTLTSTDNSACEDREVKITANVSDGYRFDSWTITAGGSPVARKDGSAEIEDGNPIYVFDMPAADVTVSAAFTRVYTVTYDANGGTGEMIDVNSPYAAGDKVTVLTNTFTKAGYNFDSWSYSPAVSVTDGKFDMPSSDVTITAQWTAKPLNSITITPSSGEVYVGQYVDFTVSYDPADYLSKGYTLNATPVYVTKESAAPANTKLRLKGGRGSGPGASITETVNETVTIKASGDNTKTASVNMTVNPLPRVHFEDLVHGKPFDDVVATIVENALSATKTTPTSDDWTTPNANECEENHLHLVGWIRSDWPALVAYLAGTGDAPTTVAITGAGNDGSGHAYFFEPGASINTQTFDGVTFYAVWAQIE